MPKVKRVGNSVHIYDEDLKWVLERDTAHKFAEEILKAVKEIWDAVEIPEPLILSQKEFEKMTKDKTLPSNRDIEVLDEHGKIQIAITRQHKPLIF